MNFGKENETTEFKEKTSELRQAREDPDEIKRLVLLVINDLK